jgi:hypothetical protein
MDEGGPKEKVEQLAWCDAIVAIHNPHRFLSVLCLVLKNGGFYRLIEKREEGRFIFVENGDRKSKKKLDHIYIEYPRFIV